MVPHGFWNQDNIDAYYRGAKEEESERPVFEYHGTVLKKIISPQAGGRIESGKLFALS